MEKHSNTNYKSYSSILLNLIIYIISLGALSVALSSIVMHFVQSLNSLSVMLTFVMQFIMFVSVLIVTFLLLRFMNRKPVSFIGISIKNRGKDILYGFIVAFLIYLIGFGLSYSLQLIEVQGFNFDIQALLMSFVFFCIISLTEEIMCRGYILTNLLQTRMHPFLALLISSLIFAMLHLLNPNMNPLSFVNLVLAGVMLGIVYLYTHNLWFPISLHLFWNWIQGPILGYEVSGTTIFSSLVDLSYPSYTMWNGGMFGFEGSVICTILMVAYILSVILYFRKKQSSMVNRTLNRV